VFIEGIDAHLWRRGQGLVFIPRTASVKLADGDGT
jgi:hypothetical protein